MMDTSQKIAIATDDSQLIEKVEKGLETADLKLTVLGNEDDAAMAVSENRAHLFLIDTSMDSKRTHSFCSAIRENSTTQTGIIAIVDSSSEMIADLMDAAVDDILVSPFTVFSLLARVNAQLKRISTAEQLAFKVRDSWTLIDITSKLVGTGDLLYSLYDMVKILSAELNADRSSVVLVREEGDLGMVVASSDNREVQNLVINLDSYPEILEVVETRKPLIVTDVTDSRLLESVLPTLKTVKVQSIALFPIIEENSALGVIFLRYVTQRDSFSQRELVFCQTVANATAIALRNHKITESLHKKDQQIEKVQSEAQTRLAALKPYEDFFMGSMDGFIILSDSGVVIFVNPEGASFFGMKPERIKGIPISRLLTSEQYDRLERLITQREEGNRTCVDLEIQTDEENENKSRTISVSASIIGGGGTILLTMRDVTEERLTAKRLAEAQKKLIQSEKTSAIVEVAGATAHELNQPLTSILTTLAMFNRIIDSKDEKQQKLFNAMETEVDRMTSIIRKLSKLTEYSTKSYVGESKIVDLEKSSGQD